ncbi:MAG TPA: GGDEF domain-containing protein [Bradyrhizobium sp.]|nr:GGDEF domain-containing protein [Bradyrhizobium sp.]
MSQGPILIVSNAGRPIFARALDEAQLFPLIDAGFAEAADAVSTMQPAAVLVAAAQVPDDDLAALAGQIGARMPYVPLIALDPSGPPPENALPLWRSETNSERLVGRLRAALRVRALHATVLRRLAGDSAPNALPETDPTRDATALLIGRGGNYPALSVALGERMGVVGALSIEAAANHLNNRDINGVVLAEGFTPRVVDAFLTVLSEDARFRNLPVTITSGPQARAYDLPNLETISGKPADIAASALPLIRQHAFEAQLNRALQALDAGGLLDPQTGLLTSSAFARDFSKAVAQSLSEGGGLSVARFAFEPGNQRAQLDGARIISRLKRRTDFGAAHHDGSVLVVFCNTDLRDAHAIARRLSSVMRHTSHGRRSRSDAVVTVATLMPTDTPKLLLSRLYAESRRAAG